MPKFIPIIIFKLYTFLHLLFYCKSRETLNKKEINDILLIEFTKIGDVLVTFPAIRILRQEFAGANISFFTELFMKELVSLNEDIDCCYGADNTKNLIELLKVVLFIRKNRYDLVLSMSPSFRNSIATLFSRAKYKLGYLEGIGSKTPFLRDNLISSIGFSLDKSEFLKKGENIYLRPLKILDDIGLETNIHKNSFFITDDQKDIVDKMFIELGIDLKKKTIVIQPCSFWKYKNWPSHYFSMLIDKIQDYFDIQIILIGTNKERKKIMDIVKDTLQKPIVITGKSLPQVAEIINRSVLFIGNDSGPMHMANMLKTPSIGLYGPVTPGNAAPLDNENNIYFYKQVECSPCDQQFCRRTENYCMTLISVEEVFSAVEEILIKRQHEVTICARSSVG